jgi:transcriptional regulator with XRE-family HTH domain
MKPEEIKALRKELRLNQKQFAESLGVSFATVSRWENSDFTPSQDQIDQIMSIRNIMNDTQVDKEKLRSAIIHVGAISAILLAVAAGAAVTTPVIGRIAGYIGGASIATLLKAESNPETQPSQIFHAQANSQEI